MVKEFLKSSKKMRRRRRIKKAIFSLVILVAVAVLVGEFFYMQKFRIKSVSVGGAESISKEAVLQSANAYLLQKKFLVLPAGNIFILSKQELKNILTSQFLKIKNIELNKDYPDRLFINIEERSAWALLCRQEENAEELNNCFYIDDEGFIYQEAPILSGHILTRFIDNRENYKGMGDFILAKDNFLKIKYFIEHFKNDLGKRVVEVSLLPESIYQIKSRQGWYVIVDSQTNAKDAFENLLIVLNEQIKEKIDDLEYIDLRFENKIYYKMLSV